jgi:PAS domain S-box-containing protein
VKENLKRELELLKKELLELKKKNEILGRDSEDLHLLNLLFQNISMADRDIDAIRAILEITGKLKHIDYAAYLLIYEGKAEVIYDYTTLPIESLKGKEFMVSESLFTNTSFYAVVETQKDILNFLPEKINGISQKSYFIRPLIIKGTPCGHLLFVNYKKPSNYLYTLRTIIDRACEIATYRIENISLIEEIRDINMELEKEVKEKTKLLTRANFELSLELEEKRRVTDKLQLFRDLLNETADSIFVIEPEEGGFIDVNQHVCKQLQYSLDELLSMKIIDIENTIPDIQTWRGHVSALKEKTHMVIEGTHRRKDGSTIPVEINLRYVERKGREYIIAVSRDITQRKKVEEIIRESEERFRALAETTSSGIFITKDTFLYVNPATERITGYKKEELLGKPFYFLIHPEDRKLVKVRGFARMAGNDVPEHYTFRIIRKDGSIRWIDFTAKRIIYRGSPAIIGTGYDITELKNREAELILYKNIFDNSLDAIGLLDNNGHFIMQNAAHRRLIGYSDEELKDKTPALYLGEETFSEIILNLQSEGYCRGTYNIYRKDGDLRTIELAAFPVKNPQGEITHYVGIKRDVTERKKLEDKIKKAVEDWYKTFDSISDFVSVHNHDFRIIKANRALADFFGMDRDELIGRHCYEIFHGTDTPYPECPHLKAIKEKKPVTKEILYNRMKIPLLVTVSPIFDEKGEMIAGVHIAKDTSQLKCIEAEALTRSEELRILHEITSKIQQRLDIGELIDTTIDELKNLLEPDLIMFYLLEDDRLVLKAQSGGTESTIKEEKQAGECLCRLAAMDLKPVYSTDINKDERCSLIGWKGGGMKSFVALPFVKEGILIGILGMAWKKEEVLQDRESFFEALSGGISLALHNSILYSEIKNHAIELEERVRERTEELQRMVNLMAGREIRMAELKEVIKILKEQLKAAGLTPIVDDPLSSEPSPEGE